MKTETAPVSQRVAQPSILSVLLIFALSFVIQSVLVSYFPQVIPTRSGFRIANETSTTEPYDCSSHHYSTEIISIDPVVIYIRNFTYKEEIEGLLEAGEANFNPSVIYKGGQKIATQARTSSSAGLPLSSPHVQCILARARSFMGTMLLPHPLSEFGVPQLVRYQAGQRFDEHHDWYDSPQLHPDGSGRMFNRVASFFVFLEDNCTKGETHFPYISTVEEKFLPRWDDPAKVNTEYRNHKKGGVAFRPVAGNAIFWVNLFANGTGDDRTIHAGLPLGEGQKTAMNIWPRVFY